MPEQREGYRWGYFTEIGDVCCPDCAKEKRLIETAERRGIGFGPMTAAYIYADKVNRESRLGWDFAPPPMCDDCGKEIAPPEVYPAWADNEKRWRDE